MQIFVHCCSTVHHQDKANICFVCFEFAYVPANWPPQNSSLINGICRTGRGIFGHGMCRDLVSMDLINMEVWKVILLPNL